MNKFQFVFFENHQKQEIVDLRKAAFLEAYPDSVDLSGLEWNLTDENSIHLGLTHNGRPVSCLRMSTFSNLLKLERNTLFKTPDTLPTPCALLSRAATLNEFGGYGLHSQLRLYALRLAQHFDIQCVLGSLEERSPRLKNLIEAGYEVLITQEKWEGSYLKNKGPVVLIGLTSKTNIHQAIDYFSDKYSLPELNDYPNLKIIA